MPLGEDRHQLAGLQRTRHVGIGPVQQRGVLLRRGDGDGAGVAEHEGQQRPVEDAVVHHEADRPPAGGGDHQGVDVADVVAHQQGRAAEGDAFDALLVQPVERVDQQPVEEAQQELWHQPVDVHGDQRVDQRRAGEQFGDRQAGSEQPGRGAGADHHEQRVEDVVGGDDPCAVLGGRAQLHQRV
ncbi:hypothetical protein D9M71_587560 [compost metagenome]